MWCLESNERNQARAEARERARGYLPFVRGRVSAFTEALAAFERDEASAREAIARYLDHARTELVRLNEGMPLTSP